MYKKYINCSPYVWCSLYHRNIPPRGKKYMNLNKIFLASWWNCLDTRTLPDSRPSSLHPQAVDLKFFEICQRRHQMMTSTKAFQGQRLRCQIRLQKGVVEFVLSLYDLYVSCFLHWSWYFVELPGCSLEQAHVFQ